ncbi:MAG: glycoside hydrolase family 28 protein [Duncaniella sp.]|nr:glycoside hydrolase family 28 protein [Duncaniella sp.]
MKTSVNRSGLRRLTSLLGATLLACMCHLAVAADYASFYTDLPFATEPLKAPSIPSLTVSLADYGGKGDGYTLNTEAFARALDDLAKRGGGHLTVPAGVWLTGPIALRSNVDLHVERDAIILFSPDKTLYPILPPDEGTGGALCTAPISATHISNFSVTGEGVIDGNGEAWRPVKRFKVSDAEWTKMKRLGLKEVTEEGRQVYYPTLGNPDGEVRTKRPRLLRFIGCSNFLIQGVVVQNSPSFHVNMILCDHFILDGIMVRCPWNAQNGDGIDLSSCHHVLLTGCSVDAGDDSICMKSGIGDVGRSRGATHDVVIDGCTVFHGHGGFVFGSDWGVCMKFMLVSCFRFIDTDTGIRIKSGRDRGGLVSDIWIEDIVMCDIAEEAILFDCYYQEKVGDARDVQAKPVTADTPRFRDVHIKDVVCTDAARAILVKGLPEMPVTNVTISNTTITARRGAVINHARDITLRDVTLVIPEGEAISSHNAEGLSTPGLRVIDQTD